MVCGGYKKISPGRGVYVKEDMKRIRGGRGCTYINSLKL